MTATPHQNDETCLAVLTPVGRAALATLALRGRNAWHIVNTYFQRSSGAPLPATPELGRHWFGRLGEAGHGFDEVVVAVKQIEPLPWIEIHCHGGPQVVQLLRELLTRHGVRECSWQEFVVRTSAHALQGQAAIALARAVTLRTAAILLDQYHGALSREIQQIILDLRAENWVAAKSRLDNLSRRVVLGRRLITPWRVVIAGAPNVGKSSLVNALVGFERSIVSPLPGTTRDLVTTAIALDGWPIELVDTAGWRCEADPLEQEGIVRAQLAAGNADLCLWLVDGSTHPIFPQEQRMGARSANEASNSQLTIVVNKIDLPAAWDYDQTIAVSAQTGERLAELAAFVSQYLVPNPPPPGAAVPFTPELCEMIERAHALPLPDMRDRVIALLEGI